MKWVDDIRDWWKWHSTWFIGIVGALAMTWLESPDLQAMLPPAMVAKVTPVVAVIGFLLRARKQVPNLPKDDKP